MRGDQLGVGLDAVRQPDDLDEQRGGGVDGQPGVDVRLDGLQAQLVHHLHRRRHDAGGDDRAHGRRPGLDRVEVHQHRADRRRVGRQAHAHLGRHAEHALAADEHAPQVEPGRLGVLAAEHGDGAVGQDDLEGEDVGVGDALGEAVRAAGVVGDVAADRARLLAARVGREVQPVDRHRPRQVEVEHAGLDPRPAGHRVDRQDAGHLGRRDHDGALRRHGAAGQAGARTAGDEGDAVLRRRPRRRPAPRRSWSGSRRPPRRRACRRRPCGTATARSPRRGPCRGRRAARAARRPPRPSAASGRPAPRRCRTFIGPAPDGASG